MNILDIDLKSLIDYRLFEISFSDGNKIVDPFSLLMCVYVCVWDVSQDSSKL